MFTYCTQERTFKRRRQRRLQIRFEKRQLRPRRLGFSAAGIRRLLRRRRVWYKGEEEDHSQAKGNRVVDKLILGQVAYDRIGWPGTFFLKFPKFVQIQPIANRSYTRESQIHVPKSPTNKINVHILDSLSLSALISKTLASNGKRGWPCERWCPLLCSPLLDFLAKQFFSS